ncbi:hypothetical protein [Natrialba sp. INN-245]|uniref:hypothetical protein n=1 Tax=Natrialba sp. INN-245 TaxID=2690967 RepID=UPI0013136B15|nr:hypothetical protein [Natrialba sp. INN-245]MWV38930.1 hypothetical protein [Natrialba sp. INN-245]
MTVAIRGLRAEPEKHEQSRRAENRTADPRRDSLLFALSLGAPVAMVVSVGTPVKAGRDEFWRVPARVYYTAVVATLAVLLWVYRYWNLFGLPG